MTDHLTPYELDVITQRLARHGYRVSPSAPIRTLITQAMTRIEEHDEQAGNTPMLDHAYEALQQALDLLTE